MISRIHGIDRHKRSSTICVYDLRGEEINFILHQTDIKEYIQTLNENDAVIMEAGN